MNAFLILCAVTHGLLVRLARPQTTAAGLDLHRADLARLTCILREPNDPERSPVLADLGRWLKCEVDGATRSVPAWNVTSLEALAEILSEPEALADTLEDIAARLRDRANLAAFLCKKIIWRGRDLWKSQHKRHARFEVGTEVMGEGPRTDGAAAAEARLVAQKLCTHFRDDAAAHTVIEGLLQGQTVTEISKESELSRQQIYRVMERLRKFVEGNHHGA